MGDIMGDDTMERRMGVRTRVIRGAYVDARVMRCVDTIDSSACASVRASRIRGSRASRGHGLHHAFLRAIRGRVLLRRGGGLGLG